MLILTNSHCIVTGNS